MEARSAGFIPQERPFRPTRHVSSHALVVRTFRRTDRGPIETSSVLITPLGHATSLLDSLRASFEYPAKLCPCMKLFLPGLFANAIATRLSSFRSQRLVRSLRAGVGCGLVLFGASAFFSSAAEQRVIHYPPANAEVPALLAERQRQQTGAASGYQARRDFRFTNRVEESGITFAHQSVEDALKWWKPAHYDHGSGLAAADVDGDGRTDLYFVNQLGPNQLWRNAGGGRFENITDRSGTAVPDRIHVAAVFGDIDNDGDPDLFVTTVRGGNVLFENQGGGRFRDITVEAGVEHRGHSSGAVFFDYDRDGRLDLLVCNVGAFTQPGATGPGGYYRAMTNAFHGHLFADRSERKLLYRNLGEGKFKNVTEETGLRDGSWAGDATFADLNADGFPDLYLPNMQGDDHYYENEGGRRWIDRTAAYFARTPWGSMGAKFLDFDQDGRFDLYVTDMHSDMTDTQTRAGRTVMGVDFEKARSDAWCTTFWTDAFLQGASNNVFGNAFYRNTGRLPFDEVAQSVGAETYWPWGVSAGDLNADGFEDLFVTAGMGYPFRYAINSVLLNEGGKRFFDAEFLVGVEPRTGGRIERELFTLDCAGADKEHQLCARRPTPVVVHGALSTRSSVLFDLDDDGDLDIVTNEQNDRPMVLLSDLAQRAAGGGVRFLKVRLIGSKSNRDGLGAVVKVFSGERAWTQFADGKSGYLAQSVMPIYFGLGTAKLDRIEVKWPSGTVQTVRSGLTENSLITIREPATP
jgi:hypothetical protein